MSSLTVNKLVIAVEQATADFWKTKFPELIDMFDGNNLNLLISPDSYRPIWETASVVNQGYRDRFAELSTHRLEGFDVNLANECNCASVYYLLRDLEEASKGVTCGTFAGLTVLDYLHPDLADIKADQEFTQRQCLVEIEATAGSMGVGVSRSQYGAKLMLQILDQSPSQLP